MADFPILAVELRDGRGKGAARAVRREGFVPGVIYGGKREPTSIKVDRRVLERELHGGGFFSKLFDLQADGKNQRALPRDIQFDVVTDVPIHVDFLRLAEDAKININVPVSFLNEEECTGLRRGGILNVVRYEIEMFCRADAIPSSIECDLTGLDIGDSLHISAISLPDGVEPTISDRDFTILTIAAPGATIEEEDAALAESEAEAEGLVPEDGEAEDVDGVGEGEAEGEAEGEGEAKE